ncbi:MAG TPA: ribosome small subunit-dependent GTPase A [Candidatus Limnocylindria bacterium]|nr:ribosome small subunit-dependent GTPase A [Candidatus Limnocylindria bacterium]
MRSCLADLGWDPAWEAVRSTFARDDLAAARVATQHRGGYLLFTASGELPAVVSGRFRHDARAPADFPVVGDWVLQSGGVIHALLPRRTAFSRKANLGLIEAQVAAANVDVVFVVAALDIEPNPRRIERYVTVAYESGAEPVLLLSKSDLCPDLDAAVAAVRDVVPGTPVHAVSARTGDGLAVLDTYCRPGRTTVFLGPSGVGKTTLLNVLTGTERATAAVRDDGRGRHTTTQRELVLVAGRGIVIDTPGMRELQLWDAEAGLAAVFADIEALARACRFADCAHAAEPGCAIQAALGTGRLDGERFAGYRKLEREEAFVAKKRDARLLADEKRRHKTVARRLRRDGWRGRD